MWTLTIKDTQNDTTETATVKGLKVVDGPDELSAAMSDTIDLLYQFKSPKLIQEMFTSISAPRWELTLLHH